MKAKFFRLALVLTVFIANLLSFAALYVQPVFAGDPPCTLSKNNLTRNGSITEGGYDTQYGTVANYWAPFIFGGDPPEYNLADNESANGDIPGSSSQYIHGDGVHFDAGIYQTVGGTVPGASYEFKVGWAPMLRDTGGGHNSKIDNVVTRMVGVDPTGGTDAHSPNVSWGPEFSSGFGGLNDSRMRITFRALSDHATVYVRIYNQGSAPSDKVFLDVMCVMPRTDIPIQTIEPSVTSTPLATDTPVPPTRVPSTRVPTQTPIPPTNTATPTPTSTNTRTPTLVPTNTPTPRRGIPQASIDNSGDSSTLTGKGVFSVALLAGSVGIAMVSILGILLLVLFLIWRASHRRIKRAFDTAFQPDDHFTDDLF